jgi:hypothetical protein
VAVVAAYGFLGIESTAARAADGGVTVVAPGGVGIGVVFTRLNADGGAGASKEVEPGTSWTAELAPGIYSAQARFYEGNRVAGLDSEAFDVISVSAGQATTWSATKEYPCAVTAENAVTGDVNANVQGLPARVGSRLVASGTVARSTFTQIAFKYYWTDWTSILGQGQSFTPSAGEVGQPLALVETVVAPGTKLAETWVVPFGNVGEGAAPTGTLSVASSAVEGRAYQVVGVPAGFQATVEWMVGGVVKAGATGPTYQVARSDVGKKLQARVTVSAPGFVTTTVALPAVTVGRLVPSVRVTKASKKRATVRVKVNSVSKPSGVVKVKWGSKGWKTYRLKASAKGVLKIKATPGFTRGKVKAVYIPKSRAMKKYLSKKTSKSVTLKY